MKDVYYENYETLTKEVEDDTKNGKTFHVCGLEVLILLKFHTTKSNYRFMQPLP